MIIPNPTPEQLADMWWRGKNERRDMIVTAHVPGVGTITGHVIGRGSMLAVCDQTTGKITEDVRHEWVWRASLLPSRPPAGA